MGVKRWVVEIREADRVRLEAWLREQNIAQALATRARIVLGSAASESIRALAARLRVTQRTVCLWRRRYATHSLDGLRNRHRAGRPRRITSAQERAVVSATLRKPKAATDWSARRLAKAVRLSSATVLRIWAEVWPAAAPGRHLQIQPRPGVRHQIGRYRGSVSGPAGTSVGAVRG
jgi:transposase